MRVLTIGLFAMLVLGGCGMAGPGVASFRADQPAGVERTTLFNDSWVEEPERSELNELPEGELSIDISERELGKNYHDPELRESRYMTRAERRQMERRKKRRAERIALYGGEDPEAEDNLGSHKSAFSPKSKAENSSD